MTATLTEPRDVQLFNECAALVGREDEPMGFAAGDANLYRYVGNSPLNGSDPSGLRDPDEDKAWPGGGRPPGSGGSMGDWNGYNKWKGRPTPKKPCPTRPKIIWNSKQNKILAITDPAGNDPSVLQFWTAVREVDKLTGNDPSAAMGLILPMRDTGTTNQLMACLDHYYNARTAVHDSSVPGLMALKTLFLNTGYMIKKWAGLEVPRDSKQPTSDPTLLQWQAGNWGTFDGMKRGPLTTQ